MTDAISRGLLGGVRLWAISDLHVGHAENREVVEGLPSHPGDWLVLGGDLGETLGHVRWVLETLAPRFARLVWVPGNHELWTTDDGLRGVEKYEALVALCREHGALTPEDPYESLDDGAAARLVVPMFTLYDYSFAPAGMLPDDARAWALEHGLLCADERLLDPAPYPSIEAWCAARCALTEERVRAALAALPASHSGETVLIGHFPLVEQVAQLPAIPRFNIWCGTQRTRDWHLRFRAAAVVSGHLHIRRSRLVDGVPFDEVSLGYPRQWRRFASGRAPLVQILPRPAR